MHALPNHVPRDGEVLGTERDVVANAGQNHLSFRILLHQTGTAALFAGCRAVNQERARLIRIVFLVPEDAREGVEERRLARPRRSQQQDPFTRLDAQVKALDGGRGPAGVPPSPAFRGDGSRPDPSGPRHQLKTGSDAAFREANEPSTPLPPRTGRQQ